MNNSKIVSKQSSLCPKIWKKENGSVVLDNEVKDALLKIVDEFKKFCKIDFKYSDIQLLGSLAGYNWNELSDLDLHIIVDFKENSEHDIELLKEYLDSKKYIWNDYFDIRVKQHDVEIYVQDASEINYSSGIYSIFQNKWLKIPKKDDTKVDEKLLKEKIKFWSNKIDLDVDHNNSENLEKLKEKIKKMRKHGLETDGEFSIENLTFKYLRNHGHIEKLLNKMKEIKGKELSLESVLNLVDHSKKRGKMSQRHGLYSNREHLNRVPKYERYKNRYYNKSKERNDTDNKGVSKVEKLENLKKRDTGIEIISEIEMKKLADIYNIDLNALYNGQEKKIGTSGITIKFDPSYKSYILKK